MNERDTFLSAALTGIAEAVVKSEGLAVALNLAPEIAAAARRIADAVMEERTLLPGGAA
jgi:hypothetical protein